MGGDGLAGIRVLDLSNVVAGLDSAYYLAHFGAEVIKIDSLRHDPYVRQALGSGGYRIIRHVVFERLVKSVDVAIRNATDRQIKRMR